MKEFALIFRLKDIADFKPSPEQMQERMNFFSAVSPVSVTLRQSWQRQASTKKRKVL